MEIGVTIPSPTGAGSLMSPLQPHRTSPPPKSVLKNVAFEIMPPATRKDRPNEAERALIERWIETEVFRYDPERPDPGRVTIRRLNRQEYNNTVRDLMQVNFKPADDFPPDDTGYGFDNIGDVLSLSPLLLEKYLAAF